MKKMLLTGTALLVIASGSAMAADLSRPSAPAPVYTKAPMMAPFSWTGFYVGGDVGYGYAHVDRNARGCHRAFSPRFRTAST